MTRTLYTVALIAVLATAAPAAIPSGPTGIDALVSMEPAEIHTYTCRFPSTKTLSACTSTVIKRVEYQTDSTPTGIVTSTTVATATDCNVTVNPNNGVTAGARAGNVYQVISTGTFTDGNKYLCNVRVDVQNVRYDVP